MNSGLLCAAAACAARRSAIAAIKAEPHRRFVGICASSMVGCGDLGGRGVAAQGGLRTLALSRTQGLSLLWRNRGSGIGPCEMVAANLRPISDFEPAGYQKCSRTARSKEAIGGSAGSIGLPETRMYES